MVDKAERGKAERILRSCPGSALAAAFTTHIPPPISHSPLTCRTVIASAQSRFGVVQRPLLAPSLGGKVQMRTERYTWGRTTRISQLPYCGQRKKASDADRPKQRSMLVPCTPRPSQKLHANFTASIQDQRSVRTIPPKKQTRHDRAKNDDPNLGHRCGYPTGYRM